MKSAAAHPRALLLLAAALAGGCSILRPAPPPPPVSAPEVVAAVRGHAERLHTLRAGDVSLRISTALEGKVERSPSLGGVLALNVDLPGLWLETEKVTRSVFSLKALGSRFWLALYQTREVVTGGPQAYARLPFLVRPEDVQALLAGPDRLGLSWPGTTMAVEQADYRFDVPVLGVLRRQVWVDRRVLTVTAVREYDALGRTLTDVRLGGYKPVGGEPLPHRLTVERPLHGVKVEMYLDDLALNKDMPASVFLPPQRPGWQVIDLDRQPLSDVRGFGGEP
jgi:hypothetical protein